MDAGSHRSVPRPPRASATVRLAITALALFAAFALPLAQARAEMTADQLRAAAEAGDPAAQYGFGVKLWLGDGLRKDSRSAIVWLSRAAAQDYALADTALGVIYDEGDGVPQDAAQAAFHYRRGARSDALARFRLGLLYLDGRGVTRDLAQAARWTAAAADQGLADAQNNLGYFYEMGWGVPRDLKTARSWYGKAAAAGNPEAKDNLAHLEARLAAGATGTAASSATLSGQRFAPRAVPLDDQWAALERQPVDTTRLPPGFTAPRLQALPSPAAAGAPRHGLRVELAHAGGAYWYEYRIYASATEARAAYLAYQQGPPPGMAAGPVLRSFAAGRLYDGHAYRFQCLHARQPSAGAQAHEVICAYLEPDRPVVILAGTTARYPEAPYPPDDVWRGAADLVAYAYKHWSDLAAKLSPDR